MPVRILKSHRARWVIAVFAAYWLTSPFYNSVYVAQAFALTLVFIVIGVLIKYMRQVWESVVLDDFGARSQLAQGIWLGFLGLGMGLVWSVTSRVVPDSEWMSRSPVVGFYLLCYIVAGTLHMTARRDHRNLVPREDIRDVLIAYVAGLLFSCVLFFMELGRFLRPL